MKGVERVERVLDWADDGRESDWGMGCIVVDGGTAVVLIMQGLLC
jgi:hypothetical protein